MRTRTDGSQGWDNSLPFSHNPLAHYSTLSSTGTAPSPIGADKSVDAHEKSSRRRHDWADLNEEGIVDADSAIPLTGACAGNCAHEQDSKSESCASNDTELVQFRLASRLLKEMKTLNNKQLRLFIETTGKLEAEGKMKHFATWHKLQMSNCL